MLGGLQLGLVSALAGRLYYLQVLESDKYQMLADENRISIRLIPPVRGNILDRHGLPLAVNQPSYRAVLTAEKSKDIDTILDNFSQLIGLSDKERTKIERELSRAKSFVPIAIKEDLNWNQVSLVQLNIPDLPGIDIEVDQNRYYPLGAMTAHTLGYVAAVAEADLGENPDALLQLPGFKIGKTGLEKEYDLPLRGKAGHRQLEVNSRGRMIRELDRVPSLPGNDLQSTIDGQLQQFAYQRLSSELSGACVVMDIYNGDILASASTPSYDPKAFYRGLTNEEWQSLSNNIYRPLTNKAIAGQYAPGSTFKMMTALAALKAGISEASSVFCPGSFSLGNATFHCWKKEGHGDVDMHNAIKHSCDVYFYQMARRLSIGPIAEMARRFGLGSISGIDIPGEKSGLIPDEKWKKAALGDVWHLGESIIAAIGQGYILATPLQLCRMVAQIANGGYKITPRMIRPAEPDTPFPEGREHLGLQENWMKIIQEAMDGVVNAPDGTAHKASINIPGMEMAGKTGTAQVRRISLAERKTGVRKNDALPWTQRDHALFVAFAPVSSPRFACAIVVEHGGGGSAVAAPIARDILIECQKRQAGAQT